MSLMQKWYQPATASAVELVLYDPRESRALLSDDKSSPIINSPWSEMSEADVATEADYIYLRRIKDKALNLAGRLDRPTKLGATTSRYTPLHPADYDWQGCDFTTTQLPVEALVQRLRLVASTCSKLHDEGNTMEFALDLEQLEFGLDSMDAYISRRPSQIRTRTVGTVLSSVHATLKELADMGFGGADDDDW